MTGQEDPHASSCSKVDRMAGARFRNRLPAQRYHILLQYRPIRPELRGLAGPHLELGFTEMLCDILELRQDFIGDIVRPPRRPTQHGKMRNNPISRIVWPFEDFRVQGTVPATTLKVQQPGIFFEQLHPGA